MTLYKYIYFFLLNAFGILCFRDTIETGYFASLNDGFIKVNFIKFDFLRQFVTVG